jgi:hypothetical protein
LRNAIPGDAEPLISDLERDHVMLANSWLKLRPLLAGIVAGQRDNLSPKHVADITAAYTSHIEREENELIPLAMEICSAETIAGIGREMAARRGVDPAQMPRAAVRMI